LAGVVVAAVELLGPVKEVYAQEHSQPDLRTEADQHRCWPMSCTYTSTSSVWLLVRMLETWLSCCDSDPTLMHW